MAAENTLKMHAAVFCHEQGKIFKAVYFPHLGYFGIFFS